MRARGFTGLLRRSDAEAKAVRERLRGYAPARG